MTKVILHMAMYNVHELTRMQRLPLTSQTLRTPCLVATATRLDWGEMAMNAMLSVGSEVTLTAGCAPSVTVGSHTHVQAYHVYTHVTLEYMHV